MRSVLSEESGTAERHLSSQAVALMHVTPLSTWTLCGTMLTPNAEVIFWVGNRGRFRCARSLRIHMSWQRGVILTYAASCQERVRATAQHSCVHYLAGAWREGVDHPSCAHQAARSVGVALCEGGGADERHLSAQAAGLMHVALPSTSTMCGTRLTPKMEVIVWAGRRARFCCARRSRIDVCWQRGAILTYAASRQERVRATAQTCAIAASREHGETVSIARPALIKKRGRCV